MSCWRVSKKHIDALVIGLFKYEINVGTLTPDEVGKELWRENYRSVNERYEETKRIPRDYKNIKDGGLYLLVYDHPIALYKLIGCYLYQTDCSSNYETCTSVKWMKALEAAIEKRLNRTQEEICHTPEWDNGPWGI